MCQGLAISVLEPRTRLEPGTAARDSIFVRESIEDE